MRSKKILLYIFLIAFVLLNITIIYGNCTNKSNIQNYFRIHVVANSDSIDDQLLKYTVAKEVNNYIETLTKNTASKEESKQIIQDNIQNILKICNNIIKNENYNYSVKAYIGKIQYDEKKSYNFYMDGGIYDSLKIVIGHGNGQNWWSIIYPNNYLELIDDKETEPQFSFGIIDIFESIFINSKNGK